MVGNPWSGSIHVVGLVLALSSALIYALYIPFLGQLQADAPPAVASAWVSAGATVYFIVVALAGAALLRALRLPPDPWLGLSLHLAPAAWAAVLGLAVFSTMVAFIAFLRGLAALGPVRTAIISTIEPFWTATVGAIALGQPMSGRAAIGGMMIAAAVVVLQLSANRLPLPRAE
jgi:drug/metabolite transporter (DMT)-like permease